MALLVPAMLILMGGLYALMADLVSRGFAEVELLQMQRNAARVRSAIDHEAEALRSTSLDWGTWSELYSWVGNRNPDFLEGSLRLDADGLQHLQVQFLAVLDEQQQPLHSEQMQDDGESVAELSVLNLAVVRDNRKLTQPERVAKVGIVLADGRPLMLASAPILDGDNRTPPRGHVVIGRQMDADYMAALSKRVALTLDLFYQDHAAADDVVWAREQLAAADGAGQAPKAVVKTIDENQIAAYITLSDASGRTVATLRLSQDRPIYRQGLLSLRYLLGVFVLAAIALLVALTFMLNNIVLRRILLLSTEVNEISRSTDLSLRTSASGRDEIGRLSREMNDMLQVIERASEKERKYIREIDASLKLAASIQSSMLSTDFAAGGDSVDLHAALIAAKSVGGDFYDFFWLDPTHLALVVADVSGKGVPAGLFMVKAKAAIKSMAANVHDPAEVMRLANDELAQNNDEAMFVTALLAVLDTQTGELEMINAGHNPPYLIAGVGGDVVERRLSEDVVLGAMEGLPYQSTRLQLNPGDGLFMYTDGVNEAMNPDNVEFGYQRLIDALEAPANSSAERNGTVITAIHEFVRDAEQSDDITVLCVHWLAPGCAPERRLG